MITKNFRSIPTDGFPEGVFKDPRNPIIFINDNLVTTFANKLQDKIDLLSQYDPINTSHTILFVWQGKFKSDVFELPPSYIDKLLNLINI